MTAAAEGGPALFGLMHRGWIHADTVILPGASTGGKNHNGLKEPPTVGITSLGETQFLPAETSLIGTRICSEEDCCGLVSSHYDDHDIRNHHKFGKS